MNQRGKLIVVPNEEVIQGPFIYSVEQGKSHTKGLQIFSDMYHLGHQFAEMDYQEAPCAIANDGHMVIKTEDDVSLVVLYLPNRVTDRQLTWIYENEFSLGEYRQVNAYSKKDQDWEKLHGIIEIKQVANKKNARNISIKM